MNPQHGSPAHDAQYQCYAMNPATVNSLRLQPVADIRRWQNVPRSRLVRLEPVELDTSAQRLDVLPPAVNPWGPWPLNQTLPMLVRVGAGRTEGTIVYGLKVVCSQCCANQLVCTYARLPTEDELQQENTVLEPQVTNNEFWNYNGDVIDRLQVEDEMQQQNAVLEAEASSEELRDYNGNRFHRLEAEDELQQQDAVLGAEASNEEFSNCNGNGLDRLQADELQQQNPVLRAEASNDEFRNCNGNGLDRLQADEQLQQQNPVLGAEASNDEFYNCNGNGLNRLETDENVGESNQIPGPCEDSKDEPMNPHTPDGSQVQKKLNPEAPEFVSAQRTEGQYTQNECVQNTGQNEMSRRQRPGLNSLPRNHSQPPPNSEATRGRPYNSVQQFHVVQNQGVLPENLMLNQIVQVNPIQILNRPSVPLGLPAVPVTFCWTPEGEILHRMATSSRQLPSRIDWPDYHITDDFRR